MTLWHLEWYRLVRTRRLLALVAVFGFFGLTAPLLTVYMEQLLGSAGEGVTIQFPDPTPDIAVGQFTSNAFQIGLLVAIVIAAGSLAFDARPELAAFLRTRTTSTWQLVLPRFVISTAAIVVAFGLGLAATWYQTVVLIDPPDVTGMLIGAALTCAYLAFAVAVTTFATSLVRSVLTAVAVAVALLLALPVIGIVGAVAPWLPSRLLGALPELAAGAEAGEYRRALGTTLAAIPLLLAAAVHRLDRREG